MFSRITIGSLPSLTTFVVDRDDQIVYVDYLLALGDEPNYSEVLGTARAAMG
ncbi:MAG: hypothetical protein KAS38_14500 [Anaerolineales bacterium]|nr:hypothetical protein [Anaerolineales bacterium]MCK4975919.1 hypothetical protein [Anaerolineales bacterium]